jgi:predicted CXXCH cytochrome family protein
MLKRYCLLVSIVAFAAALYWPAHSEGAPGQDELTAFKDNHCVACHSGSSLSGALANRYLDWHFSTHKSAGIGCEKCHGGDSTTSDRAKAHAGMLRASDPKSRLHSVNVPQTCATCHQGIASTFTQSVHYQRLKGAGLGPSCTTCHAHMGSVVMTVPAEASALCAQCHDAANGPLTRRPEIPKAAGDVVEALGRADGIILWSERLVEAARDRKVNVAAEEADLRAVRALYADAVSSWHGFSTDQTRKKADEAFSKGTAVKDRLMKKLGFAS